jgi:hypothetical protein
MEKQCADCNKILPLSSFEINESYIRNQCKVCRYNRAKEVRERRKIKNQNTDIIKKYKTCIACKKQKSVTEFNRLAVANDGLCNYCRDCFKERRKPKVRDVEDTIVQAKSKTCLKCFIEKSINEFHSTNKSKDGHFHTCKTCWKPKEWNKEKQKASEKKYVTKNPEKIKEKNRLQSQKINRRLRNSLNKRIMSALLLFSKRKEKNTMAYTGCDMEFLKKWFEFLFTDDMSWNNYGSWHIDHVIPCASFDLINEEAIQKCFNWKNLRPCWSKENMEKSSHIVSEAIENQEKNVKQFMVISLPNQPGDRVGGAE